MSLIEHDKAIEQYYQEVREKYPDVDFSRFREICRSPFIFIKKLIQDNTLPIIMVKHLGKFIPAISKIKSRLKALEICYQRNQIDEQTYIADKTYLENALKEYYNHDADAELEDDTE